MLKVCTQLHLKDLHLFLSKRPPSDAVIRLELSESPNLRVDRLFYSYLLVHFKPKIYAELNLQPDKEKLIELAHYRMPFGKFKGRYLVDLPEPYLVWYHQKGFPEGKLGLLLKSMFEIKVNGLEPLIRRIQKDFPPKKG